MRFVPSVTPKRHLRVVVAHELVEVRAPSQMARKIRLRDGRMSCRYQRADALLRRSVRGHPRLVFEKMPTGRPRSERASVRDVVLGYAVHITRPMRYAWTLLLSRCKPSWSKPALAASAALAAADTLSGESDQCTHGEGGRGEPQERRQYPPPIHDRHSDVGRVMRCTPPRSVPRPGPKARHGVPARLRPPRSTRCTGSRGTGT